MKKLTTYFMSDFQSKVFKPLKLHVNMCSHKHPLTQLVQGKKCSKPRSFMPNFSFILIFVVVVMNT